MMTNYELDLLLVSPGSRLQIYQDLGKKLTAIEPPVWAGLIATYIRKKGHSVAILDTEAEMLSPNEAALEIIKKKARLVAVVVYGHQPSASTQNMTGASAICTELKALSPEQKLLMVGGHVAALPEQTMNQECIDFVAQGEGLVTLDELLQALKAGQEDWSNIHDLWYRKDGISMRSKKVAPLIQHLDQEMPGIAWDLLPMNKYRAHNWHCFGHLDREPYAAIYTTLGCPFKCSFCCIQAPFKMGEKLLGYRETTNSYRFWSPEKVIQQIDTLVNQYGVRNIKIADEMFVLNKKHVMEICKAIIERGYDLNIWAYARVDTVKDEMLDILKKAGFNWLALGIESANETVRQGVDKGYNQALIFETVRKIQAAGIHVIGNYIFGLPDDNLETMQQTLDLALELNCEFANFYCAMAYPGSALYKQAVQEGWPLPKTWTGYSQHAYDTLPLPTKYLSAKEVVRFRDHAFHTYFTHAPYLEMIEKKFGLDTRQHIEEMTTYRLPRQFNTQS